MDRGRLLLAIGGTLAIVLPLGWMWWSSLLPDTYDLAAMGYADYGGGPAPSGSGVHVSFDQLQRRLVAPRANARKLIHAVPASYMAFDLLAVAGVDIRTQRWTTRRGWLESLAAWEPPLQLTPVTRTVPEAEEWMEVLPAAMGVEGVVVKGAASRYQPGRREWLKVNSVGVRTVRALA